MSSKSKAPSQGSKASTGSSTQVTNKLSSELSELDRAFWLVLDMDFSQHNELADLGYYYECECEDTFTFDRLQTAAAHFAQYQCNKALRPNQTVLVKYVNVHNLVNSGCEQAKSIMATIMREFELMKRCNQATSGIKGVLDVYLLCCRTDNVYYVFVEKADLNLHEYIQQHSSLISPITADKRIRSIVNKRHTTKRPILLKDAKFVLASVATTLLQLHRSGIVHGSLNTRSVFIFKSTQMVQRDNLQNVRQIDKVKLANFAFSNYFAPVQANAQQTEALSLAERQQLLVEEMMRIKDITMLYDIAVQMARKTEYDSTAEQESFMEAIQSLCISTEQVLQMERNLQMAMDTGQHIDQANNRDEATEVVRHRSTDERLEFFAEGMWEE